MEWEDYKKRKISNEKIPSANEWIPTNIKCPKCGGIVFKNIGSVFTCNPPKYKYGCVSCDWSDIWY